MNKKRLIFWLFLFNISLSILIAGPEIYVSAANKTKASAGFSVIALYPDLAEDLGLPRDRQGMVVTGVYGGSPAEKAGIREGDLITKIQAVKGKPVEVKDPTGYQKVLDAISASKPVVFTLLRREQELTIELIRSTDKFSGIVQPTVAEKPATIKVTADNSGDCRTVEGALLRSRPGDTILLGPGQYSRTNLGRECLTISSLDPQNQAVLSGVYLNGVSGTKLEGITLVSGSKVSDTGVGGFGNQITVRSCRIRGFSYGIFISGADLIIENNQIQNNGWAIRISSKGSSAKINHNLILKNLSGIRAEGQVEISNNTIIENRVASRDFITNLHNGGLAGVGIDINRGSVGMVFNNIAAFNNVGCLISPDSRIDLEYNDFYQQVIEEDGFIVYWGMFKHLEKKVQIRAAGSNILSQIQSKNYPESYPIEPELVLYTPVLLFQPLATNVSLAPLFVDPAQGDYRLAADSPLAVKGRGGGYIGAYPPIGYKPVIDPQKQPPVFGIAARPLTEVDRQTLGLASLNGLWVTEVKKSSLAEKLQIKADDVILEINGSTFKDNEEFKKLISATITSVKVFRSGKELVLSPPTEF